MTTLTVLCGLPASGKSTWAATKRGELVLTADAMRTEGADGGDVFVKLYTQLKVALASERDVIVDTCALRTPARLRLQRYGRAAGAHCVLVVFCPPWRTCRTRDAARAHMASVEWFDSSALAASMLHAVPHEGWHEIVYLPRKLTPLEVARYAG